MPDGVAASDFLKSGVMQVPTLTEAAFNYCDMKGKSGDKRFVGYVSRVISELSGLVGDKSIRAYTRADALRFRDLVVKRGVSQATVKRNFECIRAIWNFTAAENAIDARWAIEDYELKKKLPSRTLNYWLDKCDVVKEKVTGVVE